MHRSLPNNKIIDLAIRVQINLVKLAQSASHVYKHLYSDEWINFRTVNDNLVHFIWLLSGKIYA